MYRNMEHEWVNVWNMMQLFYLHQASRVLQAFRATVERFFSGTSADDSWHLCFNSVGPNGEKD